MKTIHYMAAGLLLLPATSAIAQSTGIAEDFNTNPFLLNIDADQLTADTDGTSIGANGTSLDVRATSGPDDRAKIQFNLNERDGINELSVTATLSSESVPGENGRSNINMQAYFFNDTQEGGIGDDERTGDSRVTLSFEHGNGDQPNNVVACFDRRNTDGSKSVQPGADINNGDACTMFAVTPVLDTEHTMTIGYDPEGAIVYAQFDDERIEYPVTTVHLTPQSPSSEFQIRAQGDGALSVGNFSSVNTNLFELSDLSDYAAEPVFRTPDSGSVTIENGRLSLSAVGTAEGETTTNRNFSALAETNYVEAKIALSSESMIEGTGSNIARIRNYAYNDIQDGGIEEEFVGDIFASINLFMNESREVAADVSIVRADSARFTEFTFLSNDPEILHPVLMEGLSLDTEYTASIELDKDARQLIFRFEDAMHVFDIQTDIFQAWLTSGAGVDARINGVGNTVVYADDFRTDPDALTDEELLGMDSANNAETNNESSGGGCSITGAGSSTGFMLLMALFTVLLGLRRKLTAFKK